MIAIDWHGKTIADKRRIEQQVAKHDQMIRSQTFKLAADEEGSAQESEKAQNS
jgi:hypothetical protein